jgi:hypothetical protein
MNEWLDPIVPFVLKKYSLKVRRMSIEKIKTVTVDFWMVYGKHQIDNCRVLHVSRSYRVLCMLINYKILCLFSQKHEIVWEWWREKISTIDDTLMISPHLHRDVLSILRSHFAQRSYLLSQCMIPWYQLIPYASNFAPKVLYCPNWINVSPNKCFGPLALLLQGNWP